MSDNETISTGAGDRGNTRGETASGITRVARQAFLNQLATITRGQITVIDADGRSQCGQDDAWQAQVTVNDQSRPTWI